MVFSSVLVPVSLDLSIPSDYFPRRFHAFTRGEGGLSPHPSGTPEVGVPHGTLFPCFRPSILGPYY